VSAVGHLTSHHTAPQPRSCVAAGAVRWSFSVVAWVLILGCLAVIAVAVVVPRVAGATPYTVLTGSMRPHLPPGTLVVTRPVDPSRIGIGSVVTYQIHSGRPEVVTHRVVEIRSDLTGALSWRTQGDANDVADRGWVRPAQVKGELWYAVPGLGRVSVLLSGSQRGTAVHVVAAGLLGYAALMFLRAAQARARNRRPVPTRQEGAA
jgi:signal peptidase